MPFLPFVGKLMGLRVASSRRALLALVAALGGFGAVAFAVAPLTAETALPPQSLVVETLATASGSNALQEWRRRGLEIHRADLTRAGDTAATVLRRLDVDDPAAAVALAADDTVRAALAGDRRQVRARSSGDSELLELVVRYPAADEAQVHTHYRQLSALRGSAGWSVRVETRPLAAEIRTGSARIQTQLRAAAIDARLPAVVVTQLMELCVEQPDADCESAKGDSFGVIYETLLADGEAVPWNEGVSRVLAARFVHKGVARQLTWFVGPDGKGGYFDSRGRGREAGFRVSPVEFTQITSGFATRLDPFLHRPVAHQGVDYSAPIGTPVHSVAPGVVEFAGRQSGYGNVVEVRHSSDRSTLYAHLSRIDVAAGDRVELGRVLGAVGATGWATGPHLHFEYRVAGVHQDPQVAAHAAEEVLLSAAARQRFERQARQARTELDRAMAVAAPRTTFE